ncbi:PREDICTED: uncharacterized protein LOC103333402 isoform X2 [Prunus mume]|uniref:Uncharacterized protein LOC103333402 isoform X2 n=1 Tax=Prunus mume TaxID=102107 RepID=A0ABM0P4Z7_PRUMU|nr:PREDICTED: uncharacterized protein LOC103333402 isoform X2 [Prunus mume]
MSGSVAAAGAWMRKFKEYYVEFQSLREKKVHQERNLNGESQSLTEIEVRVERLSETDIAEEIQFKTMQSTMETLVTKQKQVEMLLKEAKEQLKDLMNEQEKEEENPMEK